MVYAKALAERLNKVLHGQLTGINQYFLHARILKHMGCMALADSEYKQSLDNMKQADMLVEHILQIGGTPNLQELGALSIGDDIETILQGDSSLLEHIFSDTIMAKEACKEAGDPGGVQLLTRIEQNQLAFREYLKGQLSNISTITKQSFTTSP